MLSKAQAKYGATKGELTALLHFTQIWKYYLRHRPFIFRTDHEPLKYLATMEPPDLHTARMLDTLATFQFVIKYRPGPKHANADALSRAPQVGKENPPAVDVGTDEEEVRLAALTTPGWLDTAALVRLQEEDGVLKTVRAAVHAKGTGEGRGGKRGCGGAVAAGGTAEARRCTTHT